MGVSTDAFLAFGINLGEEFPEGFFLGEEGLSPGDIDFDSIVAQEAGLFPPSHRNYDSPDWSQYWKAKDAACEAFPVCFLTHCSGEYPMYFLGVNGVTKRASRGNPVKVHPPEITAEQIQALRQFCDKYGIAWEEPAWQLFSYWG